MQPSMGRPAEPIHYFMLDGRAYDKTLVLAAIYDRLQKDEMPRPGMLGLANYASRYFGTSNDVNDPRIQEAVAQQKGSVTAEEARTLLEALTDTVVARYGTQENGDVRYADWKAMRGDAQGMRKLAGLSGNVFTALVDRLTLQGALKDGKLTQEYRGRVRANVSLTGALDKAAKALEMGLIDVPEGKDGPAFRYVMEGLADMAVAAAASVPFTGAQRGCA